MGAKVLVIGGGFAGRAAVSALRACRGRCQVTLADPRDTSDFLPMLPDMIGRRIPRDLLAADLASLCRAAGAEFIHEAVVSLDLGARQAATANRAIPFDYVLIASGTETNFYGNEVFSRNAFKIDDTLDAARLAAAVESGAYRVFIVSGGGYTGIEVATNIRRSLRSHGREGRVIIVERQPSILGPLPEWMKGFVNARLARMGIEVWCSTSLEKVDRSAGTASVAGRAEMAQALVVWSAGVKTPGFVQALAFEKNGQGRVKADEYLRAGERCFVAGDTALFTYQGQPLRMAIQFALAQGECAGRNIAASIEGRQMQPYRPVDLGYIVPLADDRACGIVFGRNFSGVLPLLMHYSMCIFRSVGLRRKVGIAVTLCQGGAAMVDWALLVLRVGLGVMFFAHGLQMAFGLFGGPGVEGFAKMLGSMGFAPARLWSYLAAYTTLLGGGLVLAGALTRFAAFSLLIFISVAGIKAHLSKGFFLQNGGYEYTFVIAAMCLALILAGPGKFSLFRKG